MNGRSIKKVPMEGFFIENMFIANDKIITINKLGSDMRGVINDINVWDNHGSHIGKISGIGTILSSCLISKNKLACVGFNQGYYITIYDLEKCQIDKKLACPDIIPRYSYKLLNLKNEILLAYLSNNRIHNGIRSLLLFFDCKSGKVINRLDTHEILPTKRYIPASSLELIADGSLKLNFEFEFESYILRFEEITEKLERSLSLSK